MRQKRKPIPQSPSKFSRAVVLFVLLVISVEVLCTWRLAPGRLVEARYFPTRSDETSVQVLKDLIRNILTQSKYDARNQQAPIELASRQFAAQHRDHRLLDEPKGAVSIQTEEAQLQQPARLQRRADESAVDDDELYGLDYPNGSSRPVAGRAIN